MPAPTVSTKLLYDDSPLIVLPQLAALIGTDEALMLQQIHYWLKVAGKERDGRLWIYNSQAAWLGQLPWTRATLRRVLRNLEARGLIRVGNYNTLRIDRTKWYSIDYPAVEALLPSAAIHEPQPAARSPLAEISQPLVEISQPLVETSQPLAEISQPLVETSQPLAEISQPLPENTTETTSETNAETNPERERGMSAPPPPAVDNLTIDDALTAWLAAECAEAGVPVGAISVPRETATWRDDHRRKGTAPADPAADWRIWMRRAIAYARRHPTPEVPHDTGHGPTRLVVGTVGAPPPGAPAADGGDAGGDFLAALRTAARARGVPC